MKQNFTALGRAILCAAFFLVLHLNSIAQTPFTIPPRWMFGYQAGMNFSGGAPVVLAGNPTNSTIAPALEESSTVCAPSGAITFYSNGVRIYNGANTMIRDMNATDAIASNSATNGCVLVPDPSAPATQAYLFICNDLTAGLRPNKGIYYYRLGGAGVMSGPTNIATGSQVDESLAAGSDGAGGYWIVSHGMDNTFWKWHVTTGGVSGVSTQTHSPYVGGTAVGSIKISKCQNRIAYTGNNSLLVYDWDMTTGTIPGAGTALYSNVLGMGATFSIPVYGLEFSPDGSKLYHTLLGELASNTGGTLKQLNIATGVWTTLSTSSVNGGYEIGTMQIGPDDKIYVTQAVPVAGTTGNIYVGVINTPNAAGAGAGYNANGFLLKPSNAATDPSTFRGIANEAWTGPNTPTITVANGPSCSQKVLTLDFTNYFNQSIAIDATTLQWSGDNGSTWTAAGSSNPYTFNFGGSGSFTAKAKFKDQAGCTTWVASQPVTTTCPAPVSWLSFDVVRSGDAVALYWSTAMEKNNEYFDILRSSDGIEFTSIGTVGGSGNSNVRKDYQFVDHNPLEGENYYKIVQHDIDGLKSSTAVRQAGNIVESKIVLAPNPSADDFNLLLNHDNGAEIVIVDVMSKVVYHVAISTGESQLRFGTELAKGTYLLKVIAGNDVQVQKLVKE